MTNTEKMKGSDKYQINKYVNSGSKKLICNHLEISNTTFWRKTNVKVSDQDGFTLCQLKQIADILERDIMDLVSLEAKIFYGFLNSDEI
jgi:hypothetical protein